MMNRYGTLALLISMIPILVLAGCGGHKGAYAPAPISQSMSYPNAPASRPGGLLGGMQQHRTASSFAAGYAGYKAAKMSGANRVAAGHKKNLLQRHPVLTGIGAAMLTHHLLKKNEHR